MANFFSPSQPQPQQATGTPFAPQPNRGNSPFANLFTPDSPSPIFATIGTALGNPSRAEVNARQLGAAQGGVLSTLSQSMTQGRTPQQALLDLMSTEEGIDYFTKGGDVKTLVDYMASTTPPPAGANVLSPGEQLLTDAGDVIGAVPTTEAQNFDALTEAALLSPEEKAEIARSQLYANATGDMTQVEAATARMVQNGAMSPEFRDLILSGVVGYKVNPVTDALMPFDLRQMDPNMQGAPFALPIDGAQPTGAQQPSGDYSPMTAEEIEPSALQPETGEVDWSSIDPSDITTDNAAIINGAGVLRTVQGRIGQIAGLADPSLAAPVVNAMRNAMQTIKTKAGDSGLRAGNRLAADLKNFDKLTDYEGVEPANYGANLIQLHAMIDRELRIAERIAANPSSSSKLRQDVEANIYSLVNLKAALPPVDDLRKEVARIRSSEGQINEILPLKAQQAIEGLESELQLPNGNSKSQPNKKQENELPTFASEEAVWKAVSEGKVKNGDRVIVNGRELPVLFEE